jgi:hypothetical protein
MNISRRGFVAGSTLAVLGGSTFAAFKLRERAAHGTLLSAFEDVNGDQYVGGIALDTARIFGARVPMRAHGCTIDPHDSSRVLFFARRPGTQAFELRRDTLAVRSVFTTPQGRHLAGHGVFSRDGSLLYVPEYDYEHVRGLISVRETRDFRVVAEIDTHGIDTHEIAWLADGRRLLVANGGIQTTPTSYRRKLNIPTMDPSLCEIDATTGNCLGQWRLPDHLLSVRHLSLATNDVAAVGLQYEGEAANAPGIVALHRPGTGLTLLESPHTERVKFQGYVASVAVSERENILTAACPYGSGVACWSLDDARYRGFVAAQETYGLSRLADGAIVASQRDGTAYAVDETRLRSHFLQIAAEKPIRWDDHWVAVS